MSEKQQGAVIGQMLGILVCALIMLAVWCGMAILLTPLPIDGVDGVLFLRGVLMVLGGGLISVVSVLTVNRLHSVL